MINKNLEDEQSNISNNKSSISLRLNSIPSLYQSSSFNFLSEIINVIAKTNNNSEELNKEVEFLNNYNEHIDQIVKSFVTQNSTSIKNIITISKEFEKLIKELNDYLSFSHITVQSGISACRSFPLIINKTLEMKNNNKVTNEIIKQLAIIKEVICLNQEAENFLKKKKLMSCIELLNKNRKIYKNTFELYEKFAFFHEVKQKYNTINETIAEEIIKVMNQIVFFTNKDVLLRKITSIYNHFQNTKINNNPFLPMNLYCELIHKIVNSQKIKENNKNDSNDINNISYIINCLLLNDKQAKQILSRFDASIKKNISALLINTYNITSSLILRNSKSELFHFLLYMQVPLIILYHSFEKINFIYQNCLYTKGIEKISSYYEAVMCQQLITLHNYIMNSNNTDNTFIFSLSSKNLLSSTMIFEDFSKTESVYRHQLFEMNLFISNDKLPILYKNYEIINKIYISNLNVSFLQIQNYCSILTTQFFIQLKKGFIYIKPSFFEYHNIILEYENDNKNFKFINEIQREISLLQQIAIYGIDKTFSEIEQCIFILFTKYHTNTKALLNYICKDCVYFNVLKKIKETSSIDQLIEDYIIQVISSSKGIEQIQLLSKNYSVIEMISKFLSCSENLIQKASHFIYDISKKQKEDKVDYDLFGKMTSELNRIVIILKIELISLMIFPLNKMSKTKYWLHEPQMRPENSITSFTIRTKTYLSLFKNILSKSNYNEITSNYEHFLNFLFIKNISNLKTNSINVYGINLLVRNFEFITNTLKEMLIINSNQSNSIYNFVSYIKLLKVPEDKIENELNTLYTKEKYDQSLIEPILSIRTNTRKTLNEMQKEEIVAQIFQVAPNKK